MVETVLTEKKRITAAEAGKKILAWLRCFLNSYPFYIFQVILAGGLVLMGKEVEGAILFGMLICAILVICDDIVPTTLPFLLISTFTTNCYDSFDTFIGYIVYAPVVLACFAFHFIVYHKKYAVGQSIFGILAVSLALVLGGVGNFTVMEYMRGAYYFLGLGLGMAVAYLLMRSQFATRRSYDIKERFAVIMSLMGALCAVMIIIGYNRVSWGMAPHGRYSMGFSPNNIATMLMFALPFPLYLGRRKGRRWFAVFTAVLFGFLCSTSSRGGLICGSVEYVACCLYWILMFGKKGIFKRLWICFGITSAVILVIAVGGPLLEIFGKRLDNGVISTSEARYEMIFEAFDRFKKNPFVGSGILDDSIAYGDFNKKGTMTWYHMMIPQVIGSMGLVGIACYGYQFLERVGLIFKKRNTWSLCLGLSYFGILLMSQVNPGEFCPIPFELLAVLLFIFQELRFEKQPLWEKQVG
ncbi:MAG: O-antigen ligase family protein [Clostridia bacterium]|nr:O-antigen ligase family protein [Clostridia bacterium]